MEVWAIRPDGSGLAQLTYESRGPVVDPVWSPDGSRLAYTVVNDNSFIMEIGERSGRALPPLGEPNAWFGAQSWSPDGKQLAGHERRFDGTFGGVWIYSIASQKFERLTKFGSYPLWLNDGHKLLFHYQDKIHLVDARSKKVREVLSASPHQIFELISLSRDDRTIYFAIHATESDVWLATLEQ